MKNSPLHLVSNRRSSVPNDSGLLCAAHALFSGHKDALLYSYQYASPLDESDPVCGAQLWDKFVHNSQDYYIYEEETKIVSMLAHKVAINCRNIDTILDLGPGSKDAILYKSAPIIRAIQPKNYIPVDICEEFVSLAEKQIKFLFPYVDTDGVCANFFDMEQYFKQLKKPVLMMSFGSWISNIPTATNAGFPRLAVMSQLRKLIRYLPKGSRLLLSQDACQDEGKIVRSYSGQDKSRFSQNVLYRIKRDLDISGFDPSLFVYEPKWHADRFLLAHTLISQKNQRFSFQGDEVEIVEGQELIVCNSYKYPMEDFINMLHEIGLSSLETLMCNPDGVVLHLATIE